MSCTQVPYHFQLPINSSELPSPPLERARGCREHADFDPHPDAVPSSEPASSAAAVQRMARAQRSQVILQVSVSSCCIHTLQMQWCHALVGHELVAGDRAQRHHQRYRYSQVDAPRTTSRGSFAAAISALLDGMNSKFATHERLSTKRKLHCTTFEDGCGGDV